MRSLVALVTASVLRDLAVCWKRSAVTDDPVAVPEMAMACSVLASRNAADVPARVTVPRAEIAAEAHPVENVVMNHPPQAPEAAAVPAETSEALPTRRLAEAAAAVDAPRQRLTSATTCTKPVLAMRRFVISGNVDVFMQFRYARLILHN